MPVAVGDRPAAGRFDYQSLTARVKSAFLRNGIFLIAHYGREKVYPSGFV